MTKKIILLALGLAVLLAPAALLNTRQGGLAAAAFVHQAGGRGQAIPVERHPPPKQPVHSAARSAENAARIRGGRGYRFVGFTSWC